MHVWQSQVSEEVEGEKLEVQWDRNWWGVEGWSGSQPNWTKTSERRLEISYLKDILHLRAYYIGFGFVALCMTLHWWISWRQFLSPYIVKVDRWVLLWLHDHECRTLNMLSNIIPHSLNITFASSTCTINLDRLVASGLWFIL